MLKPCCDYLSLFVDFPGTFDVKETTIETTSLCNMIQLQCQQSEPLPGVYLDTLASEFYRLQTVWETALACELLFPHHCKFARH